MRKFCLAKKVICFVYILSSQKNCLKCQHITNLNFKYHYSTTVLNLFGVKVVVLHLDV